MPNNKDNLNSEDRTFTERDLKGALRLYYEKLFPVHLLFKWLSYTDDYYLFKREIAFVTTKGRYIRRISFQQESEFVKFLLKKIPIKIDIGAVYHIPPRDHVVSSALHAIEKELIFDIDITDYNDIRSCCNEVNICNKCWKFLAIACKILDRILREDFNFQHILWVFSGRRGIHCWVCDSAARRLTNEQRRSILGYINLVQGSANVVRKIKLPMNFLHSSIQNALDIIDQNFVEFIIIEQDILGTNNGGLNKFLNLLGDCPYQYEFKKIMNKSQTSLERWTAFLTYLQYLFDNNSLPNRLKYLKEEIMLHFTYPRLDNGVTYNLSHLLKAPFCIHPQTGWVCIPFCLDVVDSFDVYKVPTVFSVLDQLNDHYGKIYHVGDVKLYEKDVNFKVMNVSNTNLLDSYNILQEFITNLER